MIGIFGSTNQSSVPATIDTEKESQKQEKKEAAPEKDAVKDTFTKCQNEEACPEKGLRAKFRHMKCGIKEHFSSHEAVPRIIKGAVLGSLGAGLVIGVLGVPGMIGLGAGGAAFGFALGAAKGCKDIIHWVKEKYVDKNMDGAKDTADKILTNSLKTSMKETLYGGTKGALIGAVATLGQCSPITAAVLGTAAGAGISYFF